MLKHISLSEAVGIMRRQPADPKTEQIDLSGALGRILATDCMARLSIPPFDRSPFDGYAYRAADVPAQLQIVGTAAAGCRELPEIHAGEALRIFTGAPIPPGADAIARQEDVETDGETVVIRQRAKSGTNIIREGEDLREGETLLAAGTTLVPSHLGLLASQGIDRLTVYRRPLALLIPTGTELSEPGEERSRYGIYNSSSYVLAAYLEKIGFHVKRRDIVPDDPGALLAVTRAALESDADVVFTTGGASVGDYDFAERTAKLLGLERLFWKVNVKPGGALLVSRYGSKLLINLSGNPAAALMSLLVILRPWLEKMCGANRQEEELELPVCGDMPKTSSAVRLLRGHLLILDGRAWFWEHQGRGNGNIASFSGCELIGIVPGGSGPLRHGDIIRVLRLPPWLL